MIKISNLSHKYYYIAAKMAYLSKQIIYLNSAKIRESTDIHFTLINLLLKKLQIFFFIFSLYSITFLKETIFHNVVLFILFQMPKKLWKLLEY
jgi:hypothetical protein